MRVTALQMNAGTDKAANISQAARLMCQAVAEDRPWMVALPEMWTCLGGDLAIKRREAETLPAPGSAAPGGPAYEFLRQAAVEHRMFVHGGSLAEDGGEKLFNTTVVFNPDGREIARYRKIHLFDITTPDGLGYSESASYGRGDEVVSFEADGMRVGCAICYDLRFPELFLALRRTGAELIVLPSAFTVPTGRDHWEPLIRARAIETQCWIVAPATWGPHLDAKGGTRATFGHSLVCDPWGHIVAQASDGVGRVTGQIDRALTARLRQDMPVLEQRRLA